MSTLSSSSSSEDASGSTRIEHMIPLGFNLPGFLLARDDSPASESEPTSSTIAKPSSDRYESELRVSGDLVLLF